MNETYALLQRYVDAATDLAEGVERDIKNGNTLSNDTILRLSKFVSAAHAAGKMLDFEDPSGIKLQ